MPEGQLPVLLPPERDRGHAVDNDNHGSHQEKHLDMKIISKLKGGKGVNMYQYDKTGEYFDKEY